MITQQVFMQEPTQSFSIIINLILFSHCTLEFEFLVGIAAKGRINLPFFFSMKSIYPCNQESVQKLPDKNIQDHKNGKNHAPHSIQCRKCNIDPVEIVGFDNQVFIDQDNAENDSADPV